MDHYFYYLSRVCKTVNVFNEKKICWIVLKFFASAAIEDVGKCPAMLAKEVDSHYFGIWMEIHIWFESSRRRTVYIRR